MYNEIARNGLPIKFIFNPEDDFVERGFFVFRDTLIVVNVYDFEYDFEKDRWLYVCEDIDENGNEKRVIMSLDEYIETEIAEANRIVGEKICSKAVVLTDSDGLENIEKAEAEKRFLVYDGMYAHHYADKDNPWHLLWITISGDSAEDVLKKYNADPETNNFDYTSPLTVKELASEIQNSKEFCVDSLKLKQ